MTDEHVTSSEVSQLVEKSLKLEDKEKTEMFALIGLALKPEMSEEEIKAQFNEYVNKNENAVHKIKLFLNFDDFSNDLNSIPKHYLKNLVPRKFHSSFNEKSTKDEVCLQIRSLFASEKITVDELSHKIEIYKTVIVVEKIKDKTQLELLAANIWPDVSEKMDKKQLIKRLNTDLEHGLLTPDDVNKHVASKSNESRPSRPKSVDNRELLEEVRSLNAKISLLENEVKKQGEKINKFDALGNRLLQNMDILNQSMDSHFSGLDQKFTVGSLESLLKSAQKEFIDINLSKPRSFDETLKALKNENTDDVSLLRDGLSIMVLHYMSQITKQMEWNVSLDQFHRVLCEEIEKLGDLSSSSIEIQKIARPVSDRLNISDGKFDELLVKCYVKDLVRLEVGSPIFDDDPRWVRSGNNKYFYVKLLKLAR